MVTPETLEDYAPIQNVGGYAFGSTTSATSVIAHGLGYAPSRVKITAKGAAGSGSSTAGSSSSTGVYDGTNTHCAWEGHTSADGSSNPEDQFSSSGVDTSNVVYLNTDSLTTSTTVTFDATNITFSWSVGGALTAQVLWEAFA
jgi:hypothetical protein